MWELFLRSEFFYPPRASGLIQSSVVAMARAEAQDTLLHAMQDSPFLTEHEKDVLVRGGAFMLVAGGWLLLRCDLAAALPSPTS